MTLSNTSAVVVERYVQDDPFGKSHTLDASGNNLGNFASQVHHHKRMHGGVVDEVTGLYDFRNRWYSPTSGSWLSRDPLGYVDAQNLYQFVFGGPLLSSDTLGLSVNGGAMENEDHPEDSPDGESCPCPCEPNLNKAKAKYPPTPPAGHPNPKVYKRINSQLQGLSIDCIKGCAGEACASYTAKNPGVITIRYEGIVAYPSGKVSCFLCGACAKGGCGNVLRHEFSHLACTELKMEGGMSPADADAACNHTGGGPDSKDTKCGGYLEDIMSPDTGTARSGLANYKRDCL